MPQPAPCCLCCFDRRVKEVAGKGLVAVEIRPNAFPQGLKPTDFVVFMHGLKPEPFKRKPLPCKASCFSAASKVRIAASESLGYGSVPDTVLCWPKRRRNSRARAYRLPRRVFFPPLGWRPASFRPRRTSLSAWPREASRRPRRTLRKFVQHVVFLAAPASLSIGMVEDERAQRMMAEQGIQSGELALAENAAEQVTPFDDIAAVYALYEARIFRFLLLAVRDRDVALSLTQDTFLNAWRTRASFRGECSIATWLTYLAANLLRSHTRTEAFRFWKRVQETAVSVDDLKLQLPHAERSAEAKLIAQQELEQIWQKVEKLSRPQRAIFLLRFIEEAELAEIAKIMNMPLPTVKSHLYRALDQIRGGHTAGTRKRGRR